MFTIDLLKGQGVPIKYRSEGITVIVMTVMLPLFIAVIIFGVYLANNISISIQKNEIADYEAKIYDLSDAIKLQKSFEKESKIVNSCLAEISSSISRHTQWSDIMVALAGNMPDSMILTNLQVKENRIRRQIARKDNPEKKTNISVPVRTLQINVSGNSNQNYDRDVRDFRDRLQASKAFASKLENIVVSQQSDRYQGKSVISYKIDCIFKPDI